MKKNLHWKVYPLTLQIKSSRSSPPHIYKNLFSEKLVLETHVDLDLRDTIEIVAPFLQSTDEFMLNRSLLSSRFWMRPIWTRLLKLPVGGDASWTTLAAIRVLGEYGTR